MQILEKRTYESWKYDFDCSRLLTNNEAIVAIVEVSCQRDDVALTFGAPAINIDSITYGDLSVAPSGSVVQCQISGGVIPPTADDMGYGVPNVLCPIQIKFITNNSPDQGNAVGVLLLRDAVSLLETVS